MMLLSYVLYLLSSLMLSIYPMQTGSSDTGEIKITFENIQEAKGSIQLAIYDSEEDFMIDERAIALHSFEVTKKEDLEVVLKDIAYGEYAIAVFHDENNNKELETNFLGIPVEPYCFSGQGHSKWKPPVFSNAKFTVGQTPVALVLHLEKWKMW